ncbi:MAG TPA: serine/threonine-protein kinase, partial [Egibacteraceae bacterium]|nr:serine/threonine-protein kinase [Egibacteraceae bacterium]
MEHQLLADRYELRGVLGEGGMARVYEGFDRVLTRRVAVKLLRDDIGGGRALRERMLREARTAASFHHPNAVAVFDTGQEGRTPYIVMELVEGGTLAEELAVKGALDPARAVAVADDVLAALAAAHRRGLVHRDVKPANIMLPPGEGAKLADFGIAKGVEEVAGLTMEGQVLGTPKYLSPEQVAGQAATVRSDVYAMGVVLYEMLAGEPPFTAENPFAVAVAHQEDKPPRLDRRVKGLDPALVAVVHRCLEKDPDRRYSDADALREALRAVSAGTPVPTAAAATTRVLARDDAPYPSSA